MKTGFLIVNYNDYCTTLNLLDIIKEYSIIDLIVVVDNCSSDDSFQKLQDYKRSDKVKVIKNLSNRGYASGINFGSRYLIEQLNECNIIVSNPDIIIHSEEDIVTLLKSKGTDCAMMAPLIKEDAGYNRGWKIPTPMQDALLNLFFIHRLLRPRILYYKDDHYQHDLVTVEAVSGCFFIIDSVHLKQIDFFDEHTFLYYEENIIASKLKKIHKKTIINTNVEVFHNHSVSIDKSINHLNKYKELKKSQYYFHTNYHKAHLIARVALLVSSKLSYLLIYLNTKLLKSE